MLIRNTKNMWFGITTVASISTTTQKHTLATFKTHTTQSNLNTNAFRNSNKYTLSLFELLSDMA